MGAIFDVNFDPGAMLDEFKTNLETGLELGCQVAERAAKVSKAKGGYCPVDTGNLRNSITHKVTGFSGFIGTNVKYAPLQESINGFLRHGVDDHKDEIREAIKSAFK